MPLADRLAAIDDRHPLSVRRQTHLLAVPRGGRHYYEPVAESELNLRLLRLMDEHYLDHPYKGPRRMQSWLAREHKLDVNLKRLNRLYYSIWGLQSILPGPHTSRPAPGHKVYPYLLRDVRIERPNQVWQTDITYIGMQQRGYLYLTAWIDVYSRFVLNWSLNNTMTASWCAETYAETVDRWGAPEIVNTDQGAQYTAACFTEAVLSSSDATKLSRDGRGRATDNAFIERLWRTVKYEYIYPHDHVDGLALNKGLPTYFDFYNWARDHSALQPSLPSQHYPVGPYSLS